MKGLSNRQNTSLKTMPALDFTEIPPGNKSGGNQDTFEMFARDYLKVLGYEIADGPDRGQDGGRDLIAIERRRGIVGETIVRWLVSCKHKAHSGESVRTGDETNIVDRLSAHECEGFIGFYSSVPSSPLSSRLKGLKNSREGLKIQVFDNESIENELLKSLGGQRVAERYFPVSYAEWRRENPKPVLIFDDQDSLYCENCSKDLLNPPGGIVVLWEEYDPRNRATTKKYKDIYWCCKGYCDKVLSQKYGRERLTDGWEDIEDLVVPFVYARWFVTMLNQQREGVVYSDVFFKK
jgi:hypothetical protein